ncbi:hypothetical protein E2C01_080829 [Portunus trituberculatus]|uniref:Uncharacterized protein n=1 Tax=Portunus trituberculatus TaxID=210409 RepID=A0A5B7IX39_PORTR|nr:hypothetical protein [Portunus trituberculatus]
MSQRYHQHTSGYYQSPASALTRESLLKLVVENPLLPGRSGIHQVLLPRTTLLTRSTSQSRSTTTRAHSQNCYSPLLSSPLPSQWILWLQESPSRMTLSGQTFSGVAFLWRLEEQLLSTSRLPPPRYLLNPASNPQPSRHP